MNYLLTAAFALALSLSPLSADDFFERYQQLQEAGDQAAVEKFLEEAATSERGNPDYYAAAGNYWWGRSAAVSVPALEAGDYEVDPSDLTITDPKTGKKVGSIGKAGQVDPEISKRAVEVLAEGAHKFPHRADIALGLAHVQKELGNQKAYVASLTSLLAQAKGEPASLKWMGDADMPEPAETFLPETVQTYTASLFNTNTPATDALCGELLAAVIDAFPDHPFAYNLKGALADANGRTEEALRMLETAAKKAPTDTLILMNLAAAYAKAGKRSDAVALYKKILGLRIDQKTKRKAESALEKLVGAEAGNP